MAKSKSKTNWGKLISQARENQRDSPLAQAQARGYGTVKEYERAGGSSAPEQAPIVTRGDVLEAQVNLGVSQPGAGTLTSGDVFKEAKRIAGREAEITKATTPAVQKTTSVSSGKIEIPTTTDLNNKNTLTISEQIKQSQAMLTSARNKDLIYGNLPPINQPYIISEGEGKVIGKSSGLSGYNPIYEKTKYTYYDPTKISLETLKSGGSYNRPATKEEIQFYNEEKQKGKGLITGEELVPYPTISNIKSKLNPIITSFKDLPKRYKESEKTISEKTLPFYEGKLEPTIDKSFKNLESGKELITPLGNLYIPQKLQPYASTIGKAESDFVRGLLKSPFEKPLTTGISFGLMVGTGPLISGTKYVTLRGITASTKYTPKLAELYYETKPAVSFSGKWLNRLLLGTYGATVGERVITSEKPFYELGSITSTEILPMYAGIKTGGILSRNLELKAGLEREVLDIPKMEALDISSRNIYGEIGTEFGTKSKGTKKQLEELKLNIENQLSFKDMPQEKFKTFKKYRTTIEKDSRIKPVRELPTETIELYEGKKLDKKIADIVLQVAKDEKAIVGGSLSQKAYYKELEGVSHDIDIFYGGRNKILGKLKLQGTPEELAIKMEKKLIESGYKNIVRKGAKLSVKGYKEKFLEIHPLEYSGKEHSMKAFGYYEKPVKLKSGIKILSIREQALRKLYGGFLTERASKDIPSLKELMKEVYTYGAEEKGFPFKKYTPKIKRQKDLTIDKLNIKDIFKDPIKEKQKISRKIDEIKDILKSPIKKENIIKEDKLFYKTPGYKVPSYKTPGYKVPSYKTPGYKVPSYKTPGYKVPSYKTPSNIYKSPIYKPEQYITKEVPYKTSPYKEQPYPIKEVPYKPTPYIPKRYNKPYITKVPKIPRITKKIFTFKFKPVKQTKKVKRKTQYYLSYSPDFTAKVFGIEQRGGKKLVRRALTREFTGFETRPMLILPKGLFK